MKTKNYPNYFILLLFISPLVFNYAKAQNGNAVTPSEFRSMAIIAAPIAIDDTVVVPQDSSVIIHPLVNDTDPDGDPMTLVLIVPPQNGTAIVMGGDSIIYYPNPSFNGTDSIFYSICDNSALCDTAVIRIIVSGLTSGIELRPGLPIRAFPNPANDILTVNKEKNDWETVQFFLTDLSGRILLQGVGENEISFDIHEISPGIYFAGYRDQNSGEWIKVLITR